MMCLTGLLSLAVASIPASAQTSQETKGAIQAKAVPVCMARVLKDGTRLTIVAPDTQLKTLLKYGFVVELCAARFAESGSQEMSFRDEMCEITASQPERVQELVEERYGLRPSVLCGMAELALGQWVRVKETER